MGGEHRQEIYFRALNNAQWCGRTGTGVVRRSGEQVWCWSWADGGVQMWAKKSGRAFFMNV